MNMINGYAINVSGFDCIGTLFWENEVYVVCTSGVGNLYKAEGQTQE